MRGIMKKLLLLLALCLSFSGCARQGDVNQHIADSNKNRFEAFSAGMAGCKENAACQVGLSMAFAANLGAQNFYKEETYSEMLGGVVPWASLLLQYQQFKWAKKATNNNSSDTTNVTISDNQGSIDISGFNRNPSVTTSYSNMLNTTK